MDRAAAAAAPAAAPAAAAGLLSADDAQAVAGTRARSAASPAAASGVPTAPAQAQLASAQQVQQQQLPPLPLAAETGREYYSNLCMKGVNQCVGRVIRHRGDWAAVLLVDARWGRMVRGPTVGTGWWCALCPNCMLCCATL